MTFEGGSGEGGSGEGGTARRFAIGAVIRRSLAITYHGLFRFIGIIVAIAVPALVLTVVARQLLASGVRTTGTGSAIDFSNQGTAILFVVILAVLAMLAYLMVQAAIVVGALLMLGGRTAAIGLCLNRAWAALPRLFLAGLLLFVVGGIVAGIVGLLVVQLFGGIGPDGKVAGDATMALTISSLAVKAIAIAAVTLVWVFVPALLVERLGPVVSFKRSLALTKGRRLSILGIVLLISLVLELISALTRVLIANGAPLGGAALNVLVALFFTALAAVLSAVGYADLRAEKEGTAVDDIVKAVG